MKIMTLQDLLKKTTCVLLGSMTTADSIIHSVGLTIELDVPELKPSESACSFGLGQNYRRSCCR